MIAVNNLTEVEIDEDWAKKVIEEVLKVEKRNGDVSLAFIGPGRMRKLNKKFRGKNRVTDVLSFPEFEVPFEKFKIGELKKTKELGEIVICPREARKRAKRENLLFEKELARLLVHGLLHLLGYDHEGSKEKAEEMREKEEGYLKEITNNQ